MKVSIDQDLCIGCEACPELCPKAFAMYPNSDFAYALIDEVPEELQEQVKDAANTCPMDAILIEE